MHKAENIANYILTLADPEHGDSISNLKLQKLLYYVQGFSLAIYDTPLFHDEIHAWQYGPVVPSVYHIYKSSGANPLEANIEKLPELTQEQKSLIFDVYQVFGQYTASRLMEMTHEESPWRMTKINEVISHKLLKEYFDVIAEP